MLIYSVVSGPCADATGGSFAVLSMCRRSVSRAFRAAFPFEVLTGSTVEVHNVLREVVWRRLAGVSGVLCSQELVVWAAN